ncbi:UPF0692 protein CG33108 [Colias croceus]|uniref:UPF0692 protein CG33108 n=1 Tax=Colias crocea TaxID=72248 RepID=UPI001E27E617|nr:UPF0692 protein CG33108 [Colias croceus]
MCTIPPAPPPPPPSTLNLRTNSPPKTLDNSFLEKFPDVCEWATSDYQLWDACWKNNICLHQPPFQYSYKHYDSIMQVGPTCGLVALSMILKGKVTSDELLNITKAEGYSNNGEMFSCQDMAKLAEKAVCMAELNDARVEVKKGGLHSNETIGELLKGATLLVAYDADCNHSPCLRNGHTAHWALVCGVIIVDDPKDDYVSNPNNTFILARHGKSKFLAAWPLEQLDRSNKNLQEFSPKKQDDGLLYILPEGGMGGERGLRDQFLMFTGL